MQRPSLLSRARQGWPAGIASYALVAALLICGLLIAGCGGGGSSSSPGVTGSQAKTALDNITSGQTPPTASNVGQAAGDYQKLYNQNPNSPDDATGFAISEAAYAGLQFDTAIGGPTPSAARSRNPEVAARAARLSQLGQALAIWNLPKLLNGTNSFNLPIATDILPGAIPQVASHSSLPTGPEVQAALAQLDQDLASCETALAVPLANSSYTFTLTVVNPQNPSQTESVKLGQAEFDVLYTLIASLRGVINPFLAYNVSDSGYNVDTNLDTIDATAMTTNGATIAPSVYMPASPFLTLNTNGRLAMQTSQSQLNDAAADGIAAINDVETRDNTGYLLNPGTFVTQQQLDNIKTQISSYQAWLTSSEPVKVLDGDGNMVTTTLDLNAWFTNPPTDLKAFEPTYGVVYTGSETTLTLSPSSYPDLTFGGLFPSDFPTPVSESGNVIGPDAPTSSDFDLGDVSSDSMGWLSLDMNWGYLNFLVVEDLNRRPANAH